MRRQNPSFNLDELDLPGLRDELLAAKFDHDTEPLPEPEAVGQASPEARREAAGIQDRADWGHIGATLGQSLGQNVPTQYWDSLDKRGQQVLTDSKAAGKQAELKKQFEARIQSQASLAKQKLDADGLAARTKRENELSDAATKREFDIGDEAGKRSWLEREHSMDRNSRERAAALSAGQKVGDRTDVGVRQLGEDLKDTPQMANDLAILNGAATKDDIPGFGPIEGRVPETLLSIARPEGLEVRQAAKRAVQAYKLKITGSAASEAETANILKALGMSETATPEEFRAGLQGLTKNGEDAVKQVLSKYSPEVVRTFQERGGRTAIAPGASAPVRKQGNDGRWYVKGPDGWRAE